MGHRSNRATQVSRQTGQFQVGRKPFFKAVESAQSVSGRHSQHGVHFQLQHLTHEVILVFKMTVELTLALPGDAQQPAQACAFNTVSVKQPDPLTEKQFLGGNIFQQPFTGQKLSETVGMRTTAYHLLAV